MEISKNQDITEWTLQVKPSMDIRYALLVSGDILLFLTNLDSLV